MLYTIQDPRGYTSTYMYDTYGRVASMAAGSAVWTWTYDLTGSVMIAPSGAITTYTVNSNFDLSTEQEPAGYTTTYAFSNRFNVRKTVPSGDILSVVYDYYGRMLSSNDPLGNCTTYQYDAFGNVTTIVNALGGITTQLFDSNRDLTTLIDPLGRISSWVYGAGGLVQAAVDPRGLRTSFAYDGFGNVASVLYSDGGIVTNQYDVLNRAHDADRPDRPDHELRLRPCGRPDQHDRRRRRHDAVHLRDLPPHRGRRSARESDEHDV